MKAKKGLTSCRHRGEGSRLAGGNRRLGSPVSCRTGKRGFGGEKARKGGGRSCIKIVPLHDETDKTEMENLYEERLGTDRMLPLVFRMALPAVAAVCCTLFFAWTFPRILRQTGVRWVQAVLRPSVSLGSLLPEGGSAAGAGEGAGRRSGPGIFGSGFFCFWLENTYLCFHSNLKDLMKNLIKYDEFQDVA